MTRPLPPPLNQLLALDRAVTKKFCSLAYSVCPSLNTSGRTFMKGLEISCHGIPWFALTLICIYLLRSTEAREIEINLFLGLVYDIMIIAFIKALTRRARPAAGRNDDMFVTRGVDKFSFPSGHASRAVFAALFFTIWAFPSMPIIFVVPIWIWSISVCISRVLLQRHFILDVVGGIALGYLEFLLSGFLWIGPVACKWLGDWIASAEDEYN